MQITAKELARGVRFDEIDYLGEFYDLRGILWTKMPAEFQDEHGGYACVMWDDRQYFANGEWVRPRRVESIKPKETPHV